MSRGTRRFIVLLASAALAASALTTTAVATVAAAPTGTPIVVDTFGRTLATGWGSADTGGAWSGSASSLSVGGGTGKIRITAAGSGPSVYLNATTTTDADLTATMSSDKVGTGNGVYLSTVGRRVAGVGDYRVQTRLRSDGLVGVSLLRVTAVGAQTVISDEVSVPGYRFVATNRLKVRLQVTGTSPTTVRARVWPDTTTEPVTWLRSSTDATAGLQVAGSVGFMAYLSGAGTNAPVTASFDNLSVQPTTTDPPVNQTPTAAFTSTVAGLVASFDGSSSSDPDGTIASYRWDFGDGTPAGAGVIPAHTYAAAGTFTVTLTVTDDDGGTGRATHAVTTTAPPGAPTDSYGKAVYTDGPSLYWRLGESSGSIAEDASSHGDDGTYIGGVTLGAAGAVAGTTDKAALFDGVNGSVSARTASSEAAVTIAQISDVHVTSWPAAMAAVKSRLAALAPDYLFVGGDIAMDGTAPQYALYQANMGSYNARSFVTPGNHDYSTGSATNWFTAFGTGTMGQGTSAAPWYSYNLNGWHIVVLDAAAGSPGVGQPGYTAGSAQYNWLAADLAANPGMPIIVTSHEPRFSTDTGHGDQGDLTAAWALLVAHGADLWVSGHVHAAQRFGPANSDGTTNPHGIVQFTSAASQTRTMGVTSAAGSPLYVNGSDTHILVLTLRSSSYDWKFVRVSDGAVMDSGTRSTNNVVLSPRAAPTTYSEELWFKTTTGSGGKLIGFGDQPSGLSSTSDRHVYMQDSGRLVFGASTAPQDTITTAGSYNDGAWHHAVATQSDSGMALYVDGALAGTNPQTAAESYAGYWRIGGDTTGGSSSAYFAGTLDEVAIYPIALSASQVAAHHAAGVAAANQKPVAGFTSTVAGLVASFDGSSSSDPDGTIASYRWDFGDGTPAGTGVRPSHTYAAGGTFTATLMVTDNQGATDTVTHPVTVTAPANAQVVVDTFGRTLATGWGSADTGGAWTGNTSSLSVGGGTGRIRIAAAGSGPSVYLNATTTKDADLTATMTSDKVGTGSGVYLTTVGRRVAGAGEYRLQTRLRPDGLVGVSLLRVSAVGAQTFISAEVSVPGYHFVAADRLKVRLQVTGASPTTVRAKVWPATTTEPVTWLRSGTDAAAGLQVAGSVGFMAYLSSTGTNAPVTTSFDDLSVRPTTP